MRRWAFNGTGGRQTRRSIAGDPMRERIPFRLLGRMLTRENVAYISARERDVPRQSDSQ